MTHLPPLRLTGASILRDGEMQSRSLALAEGRLVTGPLPEVDLRGFYILPGIVDLAGARIPGPAALAGALRAAEQAVAAQGVTTGTLCQGWGWAAEDRPQAAEALVAALLEARPTTDLRPLFRVETHLLDSGAALIALVERLPGSLVLFEDRLEATLERSLHDPVGFAAEARRAGRSPQAHLALLRTLAARSREVPRHLCRLAEAFDRLGLVYGSQGDADGETRERYSMIGARVAAFPAGRKAAAAAKAMMAPVLLSAAEVLAQGPAEDLIRQGLCDALASQGAPETLAAAAWALVERGILPLEKAWALISALPAEILRLPDRGKLRPGLRADLVVVNAESRTVEATIAGGRLTFLAGEAGRRFLRQPKALAFAAE